MSNQHSTELRKVATWLEKSPALLPHEFAAKVRQAADALEDNRRGRCQRHKDDPGPSLYFDCCEIERLRKIVQDQATEINELSYGLPLPPSPERTRE